MPRNAALILLALTALLAACGPSATAPTPTPAAPTAAAATQEPTPMPDATAAPAAADPSEADSATLGELYQAAVAFVGPAMSACPQRSFPVPDPAASAKRPLDFAPYGAALRNFSPEQAAAVGAAVDGKTIPELQALMAGGALTAEQLTLSYLARIQQYDEGRLNSVLELNPAALTIAQELDAERAAGALRGPLHGIPVLLKDNIATGDGMHTTAGNAALKEWRADRDAFLVQRLREAGAIILGKNNLSEWANYTDPCMPNGFSALGGQTRNPHGPYDTLGSSSGSAASVAAGLTTVSVGSETAGSLVQPSRANGVVGMRPSKGLVSGDYIIPLEPSLDTAGPIGRSVTDVAVLLTALAAADPGDPASAGAAALADTDFTQYLSLDEARKLRVGVIIPDVALGIPPEQLAAASPADLAELVGMLPPTYLLPSAQVLELLEGQGIAVVFIPASSLPTIVESLHIAYMNYGFREGVGDLFSGVGAPAPIGSLADAAAFVSADAAARAPYGQRYVENSAATTITAEQYAASLRAAQQIGDAWVAALQANDVDVFMNGSSYTGIGATGVAAITLPTGRSADTGEPTGLVIAGPRLSDAKLIALAYAIEQGLNVRLVPDLDATVRAIDAVTGR